MKDVTHIICLCIFMLFCLLATACDLCLQGAFIWSLIK